MKNVFLFCSLLLLSSTTCMASIHDLHIEWTFVESDDYPITGFILYCEGVEVPDVFFDATARTADFLFITSTVNLPDTTVTANFYLAALGVDETIGPLSAPFQFQLTSQTPSPVQGFRIENDYTKTKSIDVLNLFGIQKPEFKKILLDYRFFLITSTS